MPVYHAPLKDFSFLIQEYLSLQDYEDIEGFADIGELATPLLEEGGKFCQQVLFPLNMTGDAEGCTYRDGEVIMPSGFKEAYQHYIEGGWPTFTCDPAYGGQGLPEVLNMPITEMICSANLSFGLTPGLSHSAYNLLASYLDEPMKARYLPKLISGEWTGVMCLTEPQSGTDLGLIRTSAVPQKDGSYVIEGTKIFISSGEHDMAENILHLVLAKLPDAPEGSKGISLFLVPKYHVQEDQELGQRNAVHCSGIEEKMGIHASSTCMMQYEGATGYLVGQPHKGLKAMFLMMNAARIYVGAQGLGIAEIAYQNALAYANERLQGRALSGATHPEKPADPITVHADVRKMLLTMRAFTQAGRALVMETALMYDLSHRHPDAAARQRADDFIQLMTPIVKAYLTDGGTEMANLAIQCLGGYGYIREYGVEQYARDARIAQIYEGTNGVQAMDLIGRKLPYKTGKYLAAFFHPAQDFIDTHRDKEAMKEFITPLEKHLGYLRKASLWMAKEGLADPQQAAAGATEYLRIFGLVYFAYIWARQAAIATEKLAADTQDRAFYGDKLDTARFYMQRILPQTISLLASLTAGAQTVMNADLRVQ
ncbi:MAG: acyl-CoA dehydrogenase [Sphaerospermopsis sp. SIO1G2]|nr:acyl-CoA dehydrogenase [Sphaerospermopsis sp. SIO1G2]